MLKGIHLINILLGYLDLIIIERLWLTILPIIVILLILCLVFFDLVVIYTGVLAVISSKFPKSEMKNK